MGFLQIFALACAVLKLQQFSVFGWRATPQNFNQGVELQKIEKLKKYFTEVKLDGFSP